MRGEAARLGARLAVARDRLAALVPAPSPGAGDAPREGDAPQDGDAPREGDAPRGGAARFYDDDTELRALLDPAATRIARLVDLAGALADGTLPDESAAEAARALADSQPHRRPR